VIRRRRLPAELEDAERGFAAVLGDIEPAKAALAQVMPSTRLPGRPLPDAIGEFEDRLRAAEAGMPAWRCPQTQDVWADCDAGIGEAAGRARRLREDAPDLGGFEGLIWAVEHLMAPLEPFERAAARFESLKVRVR